MAFSCRVTTSCCSSSIPASTSAPSRPSLDTFLNVIRQGGGTVENVDIWGRRRLAFEITKNAEGIYAVINVTCEPAAVAELDRQLNLNESVLRTKMLRVERRRAGSVDTPAGAGATSG